MEAFVIVAGLFGFGLWIAPLAISMIFWSSTRRRIQRLEARLDQSFHEDYATDPDDDFEEDLPTEEVHAPLMRAMPGVTFDRVAPDEDEPTEPEGSTPPPHPPVAARRFEAPSLERMVMWTAGGLGGLTAIVTVLFALVAAMDQGWIGPTARTTSGLVFGVVLWVGAAQLRRKGYRTGASALAGAGIGALFGALYAASGLYGLLPTPVASVAMVAVTALAAGRAVGHDDRFLAWLALIGGVLTPILVSNDEGNALTLFAYLAVLAAGFVAAASRRGWWDLIVGAAIFVGVLHGLWTGSNHQPDQIFPALVGAFLLTLPFAGAAALADDRLHLAGAIGAAALALLAAPWVAPIDPLFFDAITGELVYRSAPRGLMMAAVATSVLPLPLVVAGRLRGHTLAGLGGGVVATILPLVFAAGWAQALDPAGGWLIWGATGGVVLAGIVLSVGSTTAPRAFLSALPAASIALVWLVDGLEGPALALGIGLMAIATVAMAVSTRWGILAMVASVSMCLPLVAATPESVGIATLAGLSAATLAATSQVPVLFRWRSAAPWAYIGAASTSVILFLPLYRCWHLGLGDTVIGLLPLILGGNALLGALVLLARGWMVRQETVTAVFVGIVLLGIAAAVPLQLEERWLTVVWALEAAGLAWAHRKLRHPLLEVGAGILCVFVGIRLVLNPAALGWGTAAEGWPIVNWTLYSWGIPLIAVLLVGQWLPRLATAARGLAVAIGFALVNVEVSHAFQDAGPLELQGVGWLQGAVRSASWAAYGLAILAVGLVEDNRWARLVGFGFVMLATVKVFGMDLWDLSGFARVASLGSLAVSLLAAALLFERLVLRGVPRAGGRR